MVIDFVLRGVLFFVFGKFKVFGKCLGEILGVELYWLMLKEWVIVIENERKVGK